MKKNKTYLTNKQIFLILAALTFLLTNLFIVSFLSLLSHNFLIEFFKWTQLIAYLTIIFFIFNLFGYFFAFFVLFVSYLIYLILITYYFFTQTKLDASFLIRNSQNIKIILATYWIPEIILIFLAILNAFCGYQLIKKIQSQFKIKAILILTSALIVLLSFLLPQNLQANNNELFYFTKSIFHHSAVINTYQKYYQQLIQSNIKQKNNLLNQAKKIKTKRLPAYLDNIIILHLESVNGFLINSTNTPNLLSIAKEGIFFPYFYGNGVQTIMGQESILCSLPGSFDLKLYDIGVDKKIVCLPSVLRVAGYRNYFFTGGHLFSDHTENFMKNIGFDEIHNSDIMSSSDPHYTWGYREDIFYKKTFAYLKKHKTNRNFIYIDIGATNHWPFKIPVDYKGKVPYPRPINFTQRFVNTLFIQDQYLKIAWQEINKLWPKKNYIVIILGDHSWPAGIHPKNTFNQKGAYEENFRTALVFIMGNNKKFSGKIIKQKYSQIDIMPSLLDLMEIKYPPNPIKQSFISIINNKPTKPHTIILVQPYDHKYLAIIKNKNKFLYDGFLDRLTYFNLKSDPWEKQGITISQKEKIIPIFSELISYHYGP